MLKRFLICVALHAGICLPEKPWTSLEGGTSSPPVPPRAPPPKPPARPPPPTPLFDEFKKKADTVCVSVKTKQRTNLVLPISKMPATHPSVTDPGSGTALEAGALIPTTACARYKLDKSNKQEGCPTGTYTQTGAQLIYAYGYPIANTGNPGYYAANAASVFPIVDTAPNVYLVMTLDQPNTEPKTQAIFAMRITSSGIPAGMVKVALMDDVKEQCKSDDKTICANTITNKKGKKTMQTNTAAWDAQKAEGTFYWEWDWKYGDGMALGPIPLEGCASQLPPHRNSSPYMATHGSFARQNSFHHDNPSHSSSCSYTRG